MQRDIEEITDLIRSNHFVNEDAIKQGIVLRVLNALGWNTFDTSIVWPEYSVEGQRVDYALCHPSSKPQIFIEVKQASTFGKGEEQLIMSYAFRHGVPIAILTDGQRWNFYLPIEQCPVSDRQFYVLDLKEREAEEVEVRLRRYLSYENVKSGQSYKNAKADHGDAARRRAVVDALPHGWRELLESPDSGLILSVTEKIESLTGFKPREDEVCTFLASQVPVFSNNSTSQENSTLKDRKAVALNQTEVANGQSWLSINNNKIFYSKAVDATVESFKQLSTLIPEFMEIYEREMLSLPTKQIPKKSRWIARRIEDLYVNESRRSEFKQISKNWFIGTNYSNPDKRRMLELVKKIARSRGVKFDFYLP